MNGTTVQGGQERNLHTQNDRVDPYVDTVCHFECTIAHDKHVHLLTLLPHTTFQFHSVSGRMHIKIDVVGIEGKSNLMAIQESYRE
jgi:hypothetical protein